MKRSRWHVLIFIVMLSLSFAAQDAEIPSDDRPASATATAAKFNFPAPYQIRIAGQEEIERMLKTHGADVLVVNFWATWCPPCIEELPYFVEAAREYEDKGVQFVGLSGDFLDQVEQKTPPFLKKQKIFYPNLALDVIPAKFIPFISEHWDGVFPATVLYDARGRKISEYLKALTKDELRQAVDEALKSVKGDADQPSASTGAEISPVEEP
ncbi:redoxin domain-containing protein [Candidatus Sumerlaeota bacterium]|nr:redoxin domain-containing protein [Candidatus Sumerlaeota bacterium]